MKGKALRRAIETKDAIRVNGDVPLIVDTTELITPDIAQEMLRHNKSNRPINWKKVEEYADIMERGEWELHAQGIIIDSNGNLLTGQKRLWAVIYSGRSVYMRVSRGNPAKVANLLDRGTPQTARDLASRKTERKHSPTEASIARGVCVLRGNTKPSVDDLSEEIAKNSNMVSAMLSEIVGTKKTKSVIMILSAIAYSALNAEQAISLSRQVEQLSNQLDKALLPDSASRCFGKGAAYGFALQHAHSCVAKALLRK